MLTERQQDTYRFIHDFYIRHGYAPKLTEIADGIGIQSKGVVHRYLRTIADEGLIELLPGRHRGIRLASNPADDISPPLSIPLVGKIAAGMPIEAVPDQDTLDLASFMLQPDLFALKVSGDSMIEAGIFDGDMIIARQQSTAMNGDIVVALINNEEATLKTIQQHKNGTVTLIPANRAMRSMNYPADQVQIQGVLVWQLRRYNKGH